MQLINTHQAQRAKTKTVALVTKVHFQTVGATKTRLVRNLSTITLTTAYADTNSVVLCICSKDEAHDGHHD